MSKRNKIGNKALRRDERECRPQPERRAISTIDCASSAAVLCEVTKHGEGLGARGRKYLMRSRANLVIMPRPTVRPEGEKLAEKLGTLTLRQLGRRRSQFAARAAGAGYKLRALSPDSRFRPALQAVQDANLRAFLAVSQELDARWMASYPYRNLNPRPSITCPTLNPQS